MLETHLTNQQIQKAKDWYLKHKTHVNIITNGVGKFPPTLHEDKNNPSIWKPEHWNWFLDELMTHY